MPAEWEAHQRCFIAWPCRESLWRTAAALARSRRAYAEVANVIARYEPVCMVARPGDADEARRACAPGVSVLPYPIDDSWLRDTGPSFVKNAQGQLAGVGWRFNGWGEKYVPHAADADFAARLLADLGLPCFKAPLVAEGGAVHVDGDGTLITTGQCLLNGNRNPEMNRAAVELTLKEYLGVRKIIWLERGLDGDETDGHIDNIACFAAPGKILMQGCSDPSDPNYPNFIDNLNCLRAARDARGRAFEIIQLPAARPRTGQEGRPLVLSYVNFYIANGAIIMPSFNDEADQNAAALISSAAPGREVVQIDALDIVAGGGGIHCITQQMPMTG